MRTVMLNITKVVAREHNPSDACFLAAEHFRAVKACKTADPDLSELICPYCGDMEFQAQHVIGFFAPDTDLLEFMIKTYQN